LAESIVKTLTLERLSSLKAVGCDGESKNTGWQAGAIKHLEDRIRQPVHWLICMLHCNELPFKNLFYYLDGKTRSHNEYSGEVGILMSADDLHERRTTNFQPIPLPAHFRFFKPKHRRFNLDSNEFNSESSEVDISNDQTNLYLFCLAIASGNVDDRLARARIGSAVTSDGLQLLLES